MTEFELGSSGRCLISVGQRGEDGEYSIIDPASAYHSINQVLQELSLAGRPKPTRRPILSLEDQERAVTDLLEISFLDGFYYRFRHLRENGGSMNLRVGEGLI